MIIFLLWLVAGCLIYPLVFASKEHSTWGIGYLLSQRFQRRQKAQFEKWLALHPPPRPGGSVSVDTTPGVPFTELYSLEGNLVRRYDAADILAEQRRRAHAEKYWLL